MTAFSEHLSPLPPPRPIECGVAGTSNWHGDDRRSTLQERTIKRLGGRGMVGRLVQRLSLTPHATIATARRTFGERRLGNHLDRTLGTFSVILHNRQVGHLSRAIEHIVVSATGVWVIDAKHNVGRVRRRRSALHPGEHDVVVADHNQTSCAYDMTERVDAVRACVASVGFDWVDVHPAVCFTNATWGRFTKPFRTHGAWIASPKTLTETIGEPGALGPDDMRTVAAVLSATFPAAGG